MKTLVVAVAILLMAFPLRGFFVREWRFTLPATGGGILGWVVAAQLDSLDFVPWWFHVWIIFLCWLTAGEGGKRYLEDLFPPMQDK